MRTTHPLRIACAFLFTALYFACVAMGQTETATVSGLITDETGAVVPGAEVKLQSVERGTVATATTNDAGIYVFAGVQPGQYQITVHKPGFKQVDLLGMIVNIQDHIEQNFRLQIGSVAESVTVNANDLKINTTDASVSTVIDQSYVKNMPLNGRSFQDLILLTPGVVTSGQGSNPGRLGQTGEFSVNGQRPEENNYTIDGVSANVGAATGNSNLNGGGSNGSLPAATSLGTTQALVSVDALQEFRVQSSTYSAEYGRNPGGQFAFETKSGTNQWHGIAYDYLRNNIFDANDWFNNYFQKPGSALRQNDFGGTLGGPVKIPSLYNGKDKTFFFVSYEGLRLTVPQPATASLVPDLCMRGMGTCPSGRAPAASALLPVVSAFPVPSPNGVGDATNGFGQFIGSWSNPGNIDSTSVRFDHIVNDKLRLFFRFSNTASSSATRGAGGAPSTVGTAAFTLRTYTAGATSIFSNRLSNVFRLNYSSSDATNSTVIDAFGGSTPVDLAQLSGTGPHSFPVVDFLLGNNFLTLFQQENLGAQKQWNMVDLVNLSARRHQFKFGVDYRRLAPVATQSTPAFPYIYFSESAVEANSAFIDAIVSLPAYPLYTNFSAFAQDQWRISQRLSLSLGLRWEVNPPPSTTQGQKPYTIQGTGPANWTLAPQGTPLWHTTWYNFAPRLGVAYILSNAPGRETVVRGGGGVFFDTGQQLGSLSFFGPGFNKETVVPTGSFPGNPAALLLPVVNPPVPPYGTVFGYAPHQQLPYTLQWNGSIEQALGKSQALTLSYVGSHAARLLRRTEFQSSTNPNASTFVILGSGLTSDYDSLQGSFRRRLTRGLTALGSYTWSHCLDYGSSNFNFGYQRGNCDFDVRHNLSAAFSYDLPNVGHNSFVNAILQHWGLDDRFTARTAFPVLLNGRTLVQPNGERFFAGANLVPGQPIYLYGDNCTSILQGLGNLAPGRGCPGGRAINPLAFKNSTSGLGNAPRNFLRGFGAWQMDLAVRREFPVHEGLKLLFRAEAFNIFNHPNFGTINGGVGQKTFGQATSTLANSQGVLSSLYRTGGPRSMQFALKVVF